MKKQTLLAAAIAVAMFLLPGCENNNDTQSATNNTDGMAIVPASAHLSASQSQYSFTVEGGIPPYTWEVSDTSIGTISADSIQTHMATYSRTGSASGINSIRATDSHNTNANQNASWSAVATIVQD